MRGRRAGVQMPSPRASVLCAASLLVALSQAAGTGDDAVSPLGVAYVVRIQDAPTPPADADADAESAGAADASADAAAAAAAAAAASVPAGMRFSDETPPAAFDGVVRPLRAQTGQGYLCYVPTERASDDAAAAEPVRGVKLAALARPLIDRHLGGRCVLQHHGWWSYEYCHGEHVRQFHRDPEVQQVQTMNVLGVRNEKTSDARLVPDPEHTDVVSEDWRGGTVCDLTGAPRRVVVKYECIVAVARAARGEGGGGEGPMKPEDVPSVPTSGANHFNVYETDTCEYEVTLHVPTLCSFTHPELIERKSEIVTCYLDDAASVGGGARPTG